MASLLLSSFPMMRSSQIQLLKKSLQPGFPRKPDTPTDKPVMGLGFPTRALSSIRLYPLREAWPPLRNDPSHPRGVSTHPRNPLFHSVGVSIAVKMSSHFINLHTLHTSVNIHTAQFPPLRDRESTRCWPLKLDKSAYFPSPSRNMGQLQLWLVLTCAAQCSLLVPCNFKSSSG